LSIFSQPSPPETTDRVETGPTLAQVDPPDGLGSTLLRILIAAILVGAAIGAYFYFGQKKPVATGDIARITLYPIHTSYSGRGSGVGMAGADGHYDQLLVFAQVHVHNQSDAPLTVLEIEGNITLPDASQTSARAASPHDTERLFGAYPQLAPLRMDPLLRDTTIAPGETAEGLLIFSYSMTKSDWEKRKNFAVSVSFTNGTVVNLDGSRT
jgi:hypothetical protein